MIIVAFQDWDLSFCLYYHKDDCIVNVILYTVTCPLTVVFLTQFLLYMFIIFTANWILPCLIFLFVCLAHLYFQDTPGNFRKSTISYVLVSAARFFGSVI